MRPLTRLHRHPLCWFAMWMTSSPSGHMEPISCRISWTT
jgi:hypothetical protein